MLRPDLKKTILTGTPLGVAFLLNMGTFFQIGEAFFWFDWNNDLIYYGDSKYRLQANKEKQTSFYSLVAIDYNLDALYMTIADSKGKENLRVAKWENIKIID